MNQAFLSAYRLVFDASHNHPNTEEFLNYARVMAADLLEAVSAAPKVSIAVQFSPITREQGTSYELRDIETSLATEHANYLFSQERQVNKATAVLTERLNGLQLQLEEAQSR